MPAGTAPPVAAALRETDWRAGERSRPRSRPPSSASGKHAGTSCGGWRILTTTRWRYGSSAGFRTRGPSCHLLVSGREDRRDRLGRLRQGAARWRLVLECSRPRRGAGGPVAPRARI